MTAQEKKLEIASRPRTVRAIAPLFWSISMMALPLAAGGAAAEVSAWSRMMVKRLERCVMPQLSR